MMSVKGLIWESGRPCAHGSDRNSSFVCAAEFYLTIFLGTFASRIVCNVLICISFLFFSLFFHLLFLSKLYWPDDTSWKQFFF